MLRDTITGAQKLIDSSSSDIQVLEILYDRLYSISLSYQLEVLKSQLLYLGKNRWKDLKVKNLDNSIAISLWTDSTIQSSSYEIMISQNEKELVVRITGPYDSKFVRKEIFQLKSLNVEVLLISITESIVYMLIQYWNSLVKSQEMTFKSIRVQAHNHLADFVVNPRSGYISIKLLDMLPQNEKYNLIESIRILEARINADPMEISQTVLQLESILKLEEVHRKSLEAGMVVVSTNFPTLDLPNFKFLVKVDLCTLCFSADASAFHIYIIITCNNKLEKQEIHPTDLKENTKQKSWSLIELNDLKLLQSFAS